MTLAVTGWGCVTPLGTGAPTLHDGWRDGRCGIRTIERFDTSALRVHLGGEMPDAPAAPGAPTLRGARALRTALDEALAASRLSAGSRVVVVVATTKGFLESGRQVEDGHPAHDVALPARFVADELRERHGLVPLRGGTVSTACTSGLTAVALALGDAWPTRTHADGPGGFDGPDAIVCIGIDLLSDFVFRGFAALSAVDPAPCRPFDTARAGLNPAEGAAAIVFEPEDRARARGGRVRGRVLGAGLANDALHPTAPTRDGAGLAAAIRAALGAAHVTGATLGHVHAHGTATSFNDSMELRALAASLGPGAANVPVTTLKGSIGHTLGAAGLIELIASFEAVGAGVVPPVRGLERPEHGFDVLVAPRRLTSPVFLKTAAGFGGFNAAVVAEGVLP